jgi:hypothetical protein
MSTKTEVSPQLEFESAMLVFTALKPLSRTARQRVIALVTGQLSEIEGEGESVRYPGGRSLFSSLLLGGANDSGE